MRLIRFFVVKFIFVLLVASSTVVFAENTRRNTFEFGFRNSLAGTACYLERDGRLVGTPIPFRLCEN